jgi:hypothetical protein
MSATTFRRRMPHAQVSPFYLTFIRVLVVSLRPNISTQHLSQVRSAPLFLNHLSILNSHSFFLIVHSFKIQFERSTGGSFPPPLMRFIYLLQGRHLGLRSASSAKWEARFSASQHLFSWTARRSASPTVIFPSFRATLEIRMEHHGALPPGKMFGPFLSDSDISETPAPPNSNLRMGPYKTTGEWRREQKLLSDPMALVVSPTMVKCRQCNREIKLSMKCAYDNFHWKTHRDRCIKATKKKKKALIQLVSHFLSALLFFEKNRRVLLAARCISCCSQNISLASVGCTSHPDLVLEHTAAHSVHQQRPRITFLSQLPASS